MNWTSASIASAALATCLAAGGDGDAHASQPARAVHGVVVTPIGDPLPCVRFEAGGRLLGELNSFGEFCWSAPADEALEAVARRVSFADEPFAVAAGSADVELLVRMRSDRAADRPRPRRFFVLDAMSRGVPGAEVVVTPAGAEDELFRGWSRTDGSVDWTAPRDDGRRYDVATRVAPCVRTVRRGLRLDPEEVVPVDDALPSSEQFEVEFAGRHAPRDGTGVRGFDATGRTLFGRTIADGRIAAAASRAQSLWLCADDGTSALLRRVGPVDADSIRVECAARCDALSMRATDEIVDATPVLVPGFGEPRVVHGQGMSDVGGGIAADVPEFVFRRVAGRLRTAALDLDARSLSIRAGQRDRDVRILADLGGNSRGSSLAARGLDSARVFRGSASVTVRLAVEPAVDQPFFVTLARRGGPYSETRTLGAGATATWTSLAAGAFLLSVSRFLEPGPGEAPGMPRIEVVEEIRRVLVAPGAHEAADVRIRCDTDLRSLVHLRRR